ncbi:1,4-alpha-glucan branching enzyme [Orenia metallireducens]|uniref:1,4-alpha-glucan branching enzyme n=1 Tax=Orenia metallireducens TaxID=1413210 RepID=A0A285IHP3_9FIRM|nr:1,4-alpha-glucan branching protein domain-containing protein [Orenia metallireducens]PRX18824.1 1,4-alpha-glucan branching enzyme [Orenia metallireducens]SNY46461.1 1,4-alpha-glucan branching enzyme [Orenia metallireducens]
MAAEKGYLSLVLHAHLPFVRHPEHEDFMEENWLYEAITETYIPLINHFEDLDRDGVEYRLTMSLTPPLISMLADPLLQDRYVRHIDKSIELAQKEVERTKDNPDFNKTARFYLERFEKARETFVHRYNKNLVNAFKKFQDLGYLEIITCGATHGYLPLMQQYPEAVRAQIEVAVETHKKHLGREPRGIWLPECAYYPGVDKVLKEFKIRFFIVDTHGVLHATPRPKYGVFSSIYTRSGVAAFARDQESSRQVWSSKIGYPGDYNYREFYRDIGFELPLDYIGPYIHPDGIRMDTGIKYHKITGSECGLDAKQPYDPYAARDKAADHAGNFLFNRTKQIEYLDELMDRKPIILSPYDAELFGHWWYEGPDFINFLIRKAYYDQDVVKMISPIDYLEEYPSNQVCQPPMCSWGAKGYNDVWLDDSNDWIYRHLHHAAEKMIELATEIHYPDDLTRRALNQAARELLLAQSSDWAFIMMTGTTVEYAVNRTKAHISRFLDLYNQIKSGNINEDFLGETEWKDNIFPDIDYKVYSRRHQPRIEGKGEDIVISS